MPTVSSESAYDTTPQRLIMPYDGLKPYTPQKAPGRRTEPPVSVPIATRHRPPATDAAAPPDDPPGARGATLSRSGDDTLLYTAGLATGPCTECAFSALRQRTTYPIANSSQFVRAVIFAPAALSASTTVASNGERYSV